MNSTVEQPQQNNAPVAGIVLAAGYARRFGTDKRYVPFGENGTLLTRSIETIKPHCSKVFVVIKTEDVDQAADLLGDWYNDPDITPVVSSNAIHGMGSSLASGMEVLLDYEKQQGESFTGVLVMLGDMPFIESDTICNLIDAHACEKITFPCFLTPYPEKIWGHPVVFGRLCFSKLSQLTGDRGGRSILKAHPSARVPVVVDDFGILRDIDTPADLEQIA